VDAAQRPGPASSRRAQPRRRRLHGAGVGRQAAGHPKVQIMVQRHGNIIVVPPGFPHHVRLEALNFPGKASNISERLPSQMSNAACHQAPSLYLTACRNSIALCSST